MVATEITYWELTAKIAATLFDNYVATLFDGEVDLVGACATYLV